VHYDASSHVVAAAANAIRWQPRTEQQRRGLFLLVHWGYGSAVGAGHPLLLRGLGSEPRATAAFYACCQTMASTLFSTLGETPPPWRGHRDVLASSLGQHAVYAVAVAVTFRRVLGGRV